MKILYLNTYDSSFLHNQIIDIKEIGNAQVHFSVSVSLWYFFRTLKCNLDNIISKSQNESLDRKDISYFLYFNLPKNLSETLDSRLIYLSLLHKVKKEKYDLIHAQNGYPSGHAAYLLSKKFNIPYIITSHGQDTYRCFDKSYEMCGTKSFKRRSIAFFRTAIENADLVLGVSKYFSKELLKISKNIILDYSSNSYKTSIFKVLNPIPKKENFGYKNNDFIIIATGFFIKRKAHLDILKAVGLLRNKNIKIILIGGGPLENEINSEAKRLGIDKQIRLINFITQKELVDWYNIADITVFPSLYEPFGLGLLEAMACGLPAIATKTWGPKEMIIENINGFLVDKKSPQQISDKIRYFLDNPIDLKVMSKNASSFAKEKYSKTNVLLYQKYKKVIASYREREKK